jgi:hypothetical protein
MLDTILLIVGVTTLVVSVFWIILRSSSTKIEAQYRRLANDMELELESPKPRLAGFIRNEPSVYGTYRGRELSISVPGKGLQNTRQIETVLKIELRDKTLSAQFAASGLMGRLGQRDSAKKARWQSGDAAFDADVDVRSDAGDRLNNLLTEANLRWLANAIKKHKAKIYIGSGVIAYAELGLIGNETIRKRFEAATEFFCDLAETVEA